MIVQSTSKRRTHKPGDRFRAAIKVMEEKDGTPTVINIGGLIYTRKEKKR